LQTIKSTVSHFQVAEIFVETKLLKAFNVVKRLVSPKIFAQKLLAGTLIVLLLVSSFSMLPVNVKTAHAATTTIRQEVNILDTYFTGANGEYATSSEIIAINSADYTSPTFYLEVVASTTSAVPVTISLVNATSSASTTSITINGTTAALYRSASFTTAPIDTDYKIKIGNEATGKSIAAARIIVIDSSASALTKTQTQIEIGNRENYSASQATTSLAKAKYWYYDSSKWDGSPTMYAEVTYQTMAGVASSTAYNSPGTYTVTLPAGTASTTIELIGGGGAGGGDVGASRPDGGAGGAGGQYVRATTTANGTNTHKLVVAGTQLGTSAGNGSNGFDSTWDTTTVVAKGGAGGLKGTGSTVASTTGSTTGGVGDTVNKGGDSGGGTAAQGGAGGGGAGTTGNGGSVPNAGTAGTGTSLGGGAGGAQVNTNSAAGNTGNTAGGGGSGAWTKSTSNTDRAGGTGAAGIATTTSIIATTTIVLQVDNGAYSSWTDVPGTYMVTAQSVGAATSTRVRSAAFTPANGKHYRIAFRNGDSRTVFAIYNAKIIVDQTSPTLLEAQYLLANTGLASGTGLQNYLTKWDSAEWANTTNVYKHAVDATTTITSTIELDTVVPVQITGSVVTNPNFHATSTSLSMPANGNLDVKATVNDDKVYGSRILVQVTIPFADVTSATVTAGDALNTLTWTNPASNATTTVLRSTSAVVDAPVNGTNYATSTVIGASTVVCAGNMVSCSDTGLINGTAYHYKIFAESSSNVYSPGVVPTGSPATPVAPALNQAAYRLYASSTSDNFGTTTNGIASSTQASKFAHSIAQDGTYMYVVGTSEFNDWRIEKRLLSTGALDAGFGTAGIVTGLSITTSIYDISIDSTYMYVVGDDSTSDWRIEKRLLSTGALCDGTGGICGGVTFGTMGSTTSATLSKQPYSIAIDGTYMYVAGFDETSDWRIEKRLLTTGALDAGFGTAGIVTGNSFSTIAYSIAIDSTYMYVTGNDATPNNRTEKRLLSTGAICDGAGGVCGGVVFGSMGSTTSSALTVAFHSIAINETYMYVASSDGNDFKIEKRLLTTGALDAGFGTAGLLTGDSLSRYAYSIAIDSTYMYVVGEDTNGVGHIAKHLLSTGAICDGAGGVCGGLVFGTSGFLIGSMSLNRDEAIVIDSKYMYIAGYNSILGTQSFRMKELLLTTGGPAVLVPGNQLANQDTSATLTSTGQPFRLRELVADTNLALPSGGGGKTFKLQYATKSGTCDTSFSGETYADVSSTSPISFYNQTSPDDAATTSATTSDPTGGRTINYQTFKETPSAFTNSISAIPVGQDGLWDFSLYDNGATGGTSYCLRTVRADGGGVGDTAFGTTSNGVATSSSASAWFDAIAKDSTYMYVVGIDGFSNWRIEKRLLTTGAICDGAGGICGGVVFGTAGVVTPSGNGQAYSIAIDSTYMYVAGNENAGTWRIEKRLLTTGEVDPSFGTNGVVAGASVTATAYSISIDSTYMYVIGDDDNSDWRTEKRLLSTGAPDTNFGTTSTGVATSSSASRGANPMAIAKDSNYMYLVGYGDPGNWRIEKRQLSNGLICDGAGGICGGIVFGTAGATTSAATSFLAQSIAVDSTYMYVAGRNTSGLGIRVEKRLLSTGLLDSNFGTNGVVVGGDTTGKNGSGIAIDSTYMYVVGQDNNLDGHTEKRLLSTGAVDSNFGTNGVKTSLSQSNDVLGIVIDSTYMYSAGTDSGDGRIEKRTLSAGNLDTYTVIPEITTFSAGPTPTQSHYRWRSDSGTEVTAGYALAEDTNIATNYFMGDRIRLRFVVSGAGAEATNYKYRLEQASSTDCNLTTGWNTVPNTTTANPHWLMDQTTKVADSSLTTNSTGMTDTPSKSFVSGYFMSATSTTPALTLTTGQFTELEYSIRSNSTAVPNTTYCFRLTNAGVTTGFVYSQQPRAVVASSIIRPEAGGTSIGGEGSGAGVIRTGGANTGGSGAEGSGSGPIIPGGGNGGGGGDSGFLFPFKFFATSPKFFLITDSHFSLGHYFRLIRIR
jgi:hypothetical protein